MEWKDATSLLLPMVYDISSNITQLAERREQQPSVSTHAVAVQLRRFVEMGVQPGECSLFPALRDLLINLILPNEPRMPVPNEPRMPPVMQNQIAPSPVGQVRLKRVNLTRTCFKGTFSNYSPVLWCTHQCSRWIPQWEPQEWMWIRMLDKLECRHKRNKDTEWDLNKEDRIKLFNHINKLYHR